MQTIIDRIAVFEQNIAASITTVDKTTAKQFVVVVGVIGFFVLVTAAGVVGAFAPEGGDIALWLLGSACVLAVIAGIVGKEYFA